MAINEFPKLPSTKQELQPGTPVWSEKKVSLHTGQFESLFEMCIAVMESFISSSKI